MAKKRMLKTSFRGYLTMIAFLCFVPGAILIAYPLLLDSFIFHAQAGAHVLYRFCGLGLIFFAAAIFYSRRDPSSARDLIFWQSIYALSFSVLLFIGPWFFGMRFFVYPFAVFLLVSGLFLMSYASRNLLIRE